MSDTSIALQFLCNHFIKSVSHSVRALSTLTNQQISTSLQSTSITLKTCLEEEARQANGYIDTLLELIMSSSRKGRTDTSFTQSVREVCGFMGNVVCGVHYSHSRRRSSWMLL